jgi:hypothetical protein
MLNVKIIHFPFSDHDIVCTKIKMNAIERAPGVYVMNENTIKSDILRKLLIHSGQIMYSRYLIVS